MLDDLIKRFSKETEGFSDGYELKNAIGKAHTDMSRRASGHNSKIQQESICWLNKHFIENSPWAISNQTDFDKWHEDTCVDYCKHMNSQGFPFKMTYGRAQKVLNMTFKYLYCTTAYKAEVESIAPFLHMTLDGYTLRWYKEIVIDYINKNCSEKVKKNMISEWSKMDNEEGRRKYIQIQIDIRKYLKDSQNYQYSINSENIDDILPEQKVSTGGNNIIFVSIPFDLNRKSPFFAEFVVWEGEIVRSKIENLFKGLNGIYKSWVQDKWAISDEIKSELNIKMSTILRKLQ